MNQLEKLLTVSPQGIIVTNRRDEIIRCTPTAANLFGWEGHQAIGHNLREILRQQAPAVAEAWSAKKNGDLPLQAKVVGGNGEIHLVEFLLTDAEVDGQGEFHRLLFANDITHQWLREEQLQRIIGRQKVLNTILEVAMLDTPFIEQLQQILALIPAIGALKILPLGAIFVAEKGRSQLRLAAEIGLSGEHLAACAVVPLGVCGCGLAAARGRVVYEGGGEAPNCPEAPCRTLYPGAVGYSLPIRSENRVLGVLVLFLARPLSGPQPALETMLAVTNVLAAVLHKEEMRRERDALIWKMEKLDRFSTIAEIASAVAHEVRNPLAGIKAISQVVEDRLPPDDNNRQHLAGIIAQVDRLNNLLNDFFSYAKPPKPKREPADLKEIVAKVLPLLQSRAGKSSIAIDCRLSGDLPRVVVDSGQIQQVFLNILINALDAVKPQGSIVIDAEFIGPASPEYQRRFPGLSEVEPYLLARISDSGVGMAGEILEKICEPFYTTKSTGTGLGLAIVTRILKEHGAALYAESLLGQGSTFFLFFKTK